MDTWQIILAIVIVGLSIIMPIYYSSEKKKIEQLSIASLIGEAIGRITENKSVSSLFA